LALNKYTGFNSECTPLGLAESGIVDGLVQKTHIQAMRFAGIKFNIA